MSKSIVVAADVRFKSRETSFRCVKGLAAIIVVGLASLLTTAAYAQTPNDSLMAMSEGERKDMLTLAIASAGYACKVTDHTFKGMYKSDAYHLSGCTNGDAYLVLVPPGANAEVRVLNCEVAAAVGVDCFAPWN